MEKDTCCQWKLDSGTREARAALGLKRTSRFGYYAAYRKADQLGTTRRRGALMQKWVCTVCGYIYDPEKGDPDGGVAPGTAFEKLPADWVCPVCGASKEDFEKSTD
jgi:rubredoxin